jgi:hypothetical protein
MNPSGTAVFIEPLGSLRSALLERKALLETRLPGQAYTRHPPHATLVFGRYGVPDQWLEALQARLATVAPFELATVDWQEFPNDALAAGGHTIAYRATLTPALLELQRVVADELTPFHTIAHVPHPLANTEPFATSLRRYGSPFVGPHWIPHFTIGSPRVSANDPLVAALKSGNPQHSIDVAALSVWSVNGDHHERLRELALGSSMERTS